MLWTAGNVLLSFLHAAPPMETPYQPFDFDNYRRNPLQAKQTQNISSKEGRNLQNNLISGQDHKKNDIAKEAASLFPDPEDIPLRAEPEPIPTPNELTDQITVARSGETTKGQKDLLARGKVVRELNLESMSEADYQMYVAQHRATLEPSEARSNIMNPMPTVTNLKTDGPAHAYSVTQAGNRHASSNQNPFEDLIRTLRLDQNVTHGTDPLGSSKAKSKNPETTPSTATPTASANP
ncbi:hypothetical protein EBX31_05480 [bacterium]|nr:hypothetical protein [bacterium]